jgi:hypothetical protein
MINNTLYGDIIMLTEVPTTTYAIKVNGQIVVPNIPSRSLAETALFMMPASQRVLAEIVTVTTDGKTMLLG